LKETSIDGSLEVVEVVEFSQNFINYRADESQVLDIASGYFDPQFHKIQLHRLRTLNLQKVNSNLSTTGWTNSTLMISIQLTMVQQRDAQPTNPFPTNLLVVFAIGVEPAKCQLATCAYCSPVSRHCQH
jgi:hypothetical protein